MQARCRLPRKEPLLAVVVIGRRRKIPRSDSVTTAPLAPRSRPLCVAVPRRARGVGLPRRNNSTDRSRESRYFRAGRFAPASGRPSPTSTSLRWEVPPGRPQTRFRRVQAQLPSPLRRYLTLLANFAYLGSVCESRATLPGAAGPLGGRGPGKPRRDPCPSSLHGA